MGFSTYTAIWLLFTARVAIAQTPPTNLPPATPGVFSAQSSIIIDSPIETVWNVLLDFPAYPDWNPFVVADALFVPLPDQTPHENLRLIIQVQIPPLSEPVNANTPPNPLNTQYSFENITAVEPDIYRVSWRELMIPAPLLSAERWQALSVWEGKTYYEAREVYAGPVGYVVNALFAAGLQEGFDAQAGALKGRVEAMARR